MPDQSGSLVRLAGSERAPLPGATETAPLDAAERAEVTIVLRRRAGLPEEIITGPTVLSADELAERYGADPGDVDLVRQELGGRGLAVTAVYPATRRVKVAGSLGDLSSAFGTTLRQVTSPALVGRGQVAHRYREGPLYVPAALDGVVTAVLGLDTRPQARPHFRTAAAAAAGTSYTPPQVASIYDFPAGTTGAGQTIAVIELGGGFTTSDLDTYFASLGLAVPSVTAASVDGATNDPSDTSGADVEVSLDIDVIGAVAPGAAQVVYFAPNNGDQGFVDAISDAAEASPAPIAISISWGESEDSWTAQGLSAMNSAISDAAALGITVCVAAGDNSSTDGVTDGQQHVDFPASSPYALGCGGTKLVADPATGTVTSEVVWNELASNEGATGGGVSDQFAVPSWQADAGVPARVTSTSTTTTSTAGRSIRRGRRRGARLSTIAPTTTQPALGLLGPGGRIWVRGFRVRGFRVGRRGDGGRARGAGRGRQRRPGHRVPDLLRRPGSGGRRDQRGRAAVVGADRPAGPVHRQAVRPAPDTRVRGYITRPGRGRLPRHHQREQRRLLGRPGLGRLLRPRRPERDGAADPAAGLMA